MPEVLKNDNHNYIESFTRNGEMVVMIGPDFEETARTLVRTTEDLKKETENRL
ncbi:MAG: hypothetical protein IKP81_02565 [Paludibacteraceae bacterium]|nr:hypothetical protein [Paludibacteraceae bacterium]